MTKYKATITCDQKVWNKFKDWATRKGSNASEQIEEFMRQCTEKPDIQQEDYLQSLIQKIVRETLTSGNFEPTEKCAQSSLNEKLAQNSFNRNLSADTKVKNSLFDDLHSSNTDNTDSTDSTDSSEENSPNSTDKADSLTDSLDTDNTDEPDQESHQIVSDSEVARKTGISVTALQQYRFANRIPKLDQGKLKNYSFDLQGWYHTDKKDREFLTDRELKEKLNLTQHKSTIMRWRRGLTRTPDFVAEKYQIEEGKWVKIN